MIPLLIVILIPICGRDNHVSGGAVNGFDISRKLTSAARVLEEIDKPKGVEYR